MSDVIREVAERYCLTWKQVALLTFDQLWYLWSIK